jgi:hypothetical protein
MAVYAHSDSFEDYTGGVITDATAYPGITHVVALVGWGTDEASGLDYWAVRNSFGTYWGEQGFYRVQRGINAFNMEVEEEGRAIQERGMNDYERGACVKGAEVCSCFPKLSCRFFCVSFVLNQLTSLLLLLLLSSLSSTLLLLLSQSGVCEWATPTQDSVDALIANAALP